MVLLEFSMSPLDKGESVGDYVARSVDIIDKSGLPYELNSMGTILEGEWDEVFGVVKKCYDRMSEDCNRVTATIKIDARKGMSGRIRGKVKAIEKRLGKLLAALIACLVPLFAVSAARADLELDAKAIESRLIAPCCWTYVVAQHNSEAAETIKKEVREMLSQGKSEKEILGFYEAKFGERILTTPKPEGFNLSVWVIPPVALVFGALLAAAFLRRWRRKPQAREKEPAILPGDEKYTKQIDEELYGKNESA